MIVAFLDMDGYQVIISGNTEEEFSKAVQAAQGTVSKKIWDLFEGFLKKF